MGLLALATACPATAPPRAPAEVTAAHIDAARRGDRAAAYALLSPEARARALPWPDPARLPGEPPEETERDARWTLPEGRRLVVVRDAAGWRIAQGVLGLGRSTTPEEALRTLARAIRSANYDLLLELVVEAERVQTNATELARHVEQPEARGAWQRLAELIEAGSFQLKWSADGNTVTAVLPEAHRVTLARERGGWKVLDVRPWRP